MTSQIVRYLWNVRNVHGYGCRCGYPAYYGKKLAAASLLPFFHYRHSFVSTSTHPRIRRYLKYVPLPPYFLFFVLLLPLEDISGVCKMKIQNLLCLALVGMLLLASASAQKKDLLRLRNGKSLEAVVIDLTNDSLHYRLPSLKKQYTMPRSAVEKIEYSDGTIVSLDESGAVVASVNEAWRTVGITKKFNDTKGMISVEKIDVTLTTGSNMQKTKPAELEASAMMQLQQQALEKKATLIYIKSSEFKTAYGEPPAIHIVGESFRPIPQKRAKKK